MMAWVTDSPNWANTASPASTIVSCRRCRAGWGSGANLDKWADADFATARKWVAAYKTSARRCSAARSIAWSRRPATMPRRPLCMWGRTGVRRCCSRCCIRPCGATNPAAIHAQGLDRPDLYGADARRLGTACGRARPGVGGVLDEPGFARAAEGGLCGYGLRVRGGGIGLTARRALGGPSGRARGNTTMDRTIAIVLAALFLTSCEQRTVHKTTKNNLQLSMSRSPRRPRWDPRRASNRL